jgi:osmotically-inducible protein OsmY
MRAILDRRLGMTIAETCGEGERTMTLTLTTQEQRLRDDILRHLEWDPQFDASRVGATVNEGIVTLSGYVDTYAAKLAAERCARKLYGVRGVANELQVALAEERIDPDLVKDALFALKNRVDVPPGIEVTVRNGVISLGGSVAWMYQKLAAERAVKYLRGVRGVMNHISIRPMATPRDVQHRIIESLHRVADIDARRIHVDAEGRTVTLSGNVKSYAEKVEAERAAWTAPGVSEVRNRIGIIP